MSLDGWIKKAEEEAEKLPSTGGEFWKPADGMYKVLLGEPKFRDQEFNKKDGTVEKRRMADFPILLVEDGQVAGKATWSMRVSKHEKSVYQKVLRAAKEALKANDVTEVDGQKYFALIVEVKGEGLNREWRVDSVSEYKRKLEEVSKL
ncbi:hypothetical protein [Candidatus Pyrohabitans sp.]